MTRRAERTAHALAVIGLLLVVPACTRGANDALPTAPLALRSHGVDVRTMSADDVRALGAERVAVDDPHEHATIDVIGVRASALFDAAFGPAWRSADDIVATCADGFHPAIPARLFLEREAYVAYARPDGRRFSVQAGPGESTLVGPYYLVWKKGAGADPPEPAWPYQVTGLELTDFASRFAAAIPPSGSDPLAREGFERFHTFCLPCHAINGAGGDVGPELNYPTNVTEYFAEPTLRLWLVDPRQVRGNAKMAPPLRDDDQRARSIDAIIAYLKTMAHAKRAPRP